MYQWSNRIKHLTHSRTKKKQTFSKDSKSNKKGSIHGNDLLEQIAQFVKFIICYINLRDLFFLVEDTRQQFWNVSKMHHVRAQNVHTYNMRFEFFFLEKIIQITTNSFRQGGK